MRNSKETEREYRDWNSWFEQAPQRFDDACATDPEPGAGSGAPGIGTLREKTLHAVLKRFFEPDPAFHEIPVGSYVADIARPDGVIEIQTGGLSGLRPKLRTLLDSVPVTLVMPIIRTKWLLWVDPDSGEVTRPRKSPRAGRPVDAFRELVRVEALLDHPGLTVLLVLLDVEEYRYLNGWSRDRKRGSARMDRLPKAFADWRILRRPEDLDTLLPAPLPVPFRTCDLAEQYRMPRREVQTMVHVLQKADRIRRTGKDGRFYVYMPADAARDTIEA